MGMSQFITLHQLVLDDDGAPTRETRCADINVDAIELIGTTSKPFHNSEIMFRGVNRSIPVIETVAEIRKLIQNPSKTGKSYRSYV